MSCSEGAAVLKLSSLCSPLTSNLLVRCSTHSSTEAEWLPSGKCMKARCGDPSSSPYPFCLVMEMWHGGWVQPIDSVCVCVWWWGLWWWWWWWGGGKDWVGDRKYERGKRESNTHTRLRDGEWSQETDREEVQHDPPHFSQQLHCNIDHLVAPRRVVDAKKQPLF